MIQSSEVKEFANNRRDCTDASAQRKYGFGKQLNTAWHDRQDEHYGSLGKLVCVSIEIDILESLVNSVQFDVSYHLKFEQIHIYPWYKPILVIGFATKMMTKMIYLQEYKTSAYVYVWRVSYICSNSYI